MKKLVTLLFILLPVCAQAFSTTETMTVIDVEGQPVADVGAIGPRTFGVRPNSTDYRFMVSDTSLQLHYDNIVLGKNNFGTGVDGGSITFKLKNPGYNDVPIGNIGYRSVAPWEWSFNAGSALVKDTSIGFYTLNSSNSDTLRLKIFGGYDNSIVATTGSFAVGSTTLYNPIGLSNVVSVRGTTSAGYVFSLPNQTWTVAAISGYSNSLGFYNGTSYSAMMFPSGRTGVGATSDDGVHTLQVGGKITQSGNALNIATAQTPATSSSACRTGDIAWDANYVYVCVLTNTWKRTNLATW